MGGLKRLGLAAALPAAVLAVVGVTQPVFADPQRAPTADFIIDVEVTRDTDHALRAPARYVSVGRKIRVDYNGLSTLYDLSRRKFEVTIPRVRIAALPEDIKGEVIDSRRWLGVEARTAERIGSDTLLDRPVTKYRVTGTMFEARVPFEGEVWTTAENIVVKVDGVSKVGKETPSPIQITAVQIAVGGIDAALVNVPKNFRRAPASEVYTEDDK